MQLATVQTQSHPLGTCPHGLPAGACPICSGMGGGGGVSRRDTVRNAGELTWNQCAAIGAMMKAQKAEKLAKEVEQQQYLIALAKFQNNLENISRKIADLTAFLTNNTPKIISKPLNFILNNIAAKVVEVMKNLPENITRLLVNITQKLADITDKLTAIVGEFKAAIEKHISEAFKNVKKKIKSLFSIFSINNADDEDKKIDEDKRAFELRTFIHDLYKKLTKEEKDNSDES